MVAIRGNGMEMCGDGCCASVGMCEDVWRFEEMVLKVWRCVEMV